MENIDVREAGREAGIDISKMLDELHPWMVVSGAQAGDVEDCENCREISCEQHPNHVEYLRDELNDAQIYIAALGRVIGEQFGRDAQFSVGLQVLALANDLAAKLKSTGEPSGEPSGGDSDGTDA